MSRLDSMFQMYGAPLLRHWFGVSLTLVRGSRETTSVLATWIKLADDFDDEGVPLRITHRVYRIPVASYVINEAVVAPRAGDRIKETIASVVVTFQVLPTSDEVPAWELAGDGADWIVRTQRIS